MAVPVLIYVQGVGGIVGLEIFEYGVADVPVCPRASGPGFYHEHLCALVGVDVSHVDEFDCASGYLFFC